MRGRGHEKIEQQGIDSKISDHRGQPVIRLPKSMLDIGVKLNQEIKIVYVRKINPLENEIIIKLSSKTRTKKPRLSIKINKLEKKEEE